MVDERDLLAAVEGALRLLRQRPKHEEVTAALDGALALDRGVTPERVETLGGGWVAEEALAVEQLRPRFPGAGPPPETCGQMDQSVSVHELR